MCARFFFLCFPCGLPGVGVPFGFPFAPFWFPRGLGSPFGFPFLGFPFLGFPFWFLFVLLGFLGFWCLFGFPLCGSPFSAFATSYMVSTSGYVGFHRFFSSITYHQFHSTIFEIHVNVILYWGFEGFILVLGHSIAFSISALAFSLSSCGFACGFGHL